MLNIKTLLITATLLGAGASAAAQAPAEMVVGLDSCRNMALTNNKRLKMAAESTRKAGYQRQEAFAAYLPAIDFTGGYMYNQKNVSVFGSDQLLPVKTFDLATQSYQFSLVKNPVTGEPVKGPDGQYIPEQVAYMPKEALEFDIHNLFGGAVTVTQPVYMGGKIVALNRLAKAAENAARAMESNQAQDIVTAVDAAYWQVVSLRAKDELATGYVALLDSLRRDVELMVQHGVATRSDLLQVEVKLTAAEVDLTKVRNGLVLSRMALAQLCGLPVDTPVTPGDCADDLVAAAARLVPAGTDADMDEVFSRRDDLRALGYAIEARHQQAKVALSSMLPNLAVVGSYGFSNPSLFKGFRHHVDGAFSVGAMLTVPVWHWGGNYNKYRAAKADETIARLELEDAREMVTLQVRQAAYRTSESLKLLAATQTNVAKADLNLKQARAAYREGMMTTDNVLEAQTGWLKARSENIDAAIDAQLCQVYLSKAMGTLDTPNRIH